MNTIKLTIKGIVNPKKINVDEFVSSWKDILRNLALHHSLNHGWVPSQ